MDASSASIASRLASVATRVAGSLSSYEDVVALALVGSVARGNSVSDSDIDLLVVTREPTRQTLLMARLPPALREERLSLLSFSITRWQEEADRGSLFLNHVRLEGKTLYDPDCVLERGLEVVAMRPPDVEGEVQAQLHRLRLYRDVTRLNGQHFFALAHLYAIGKATAIARCVGLGELVFVKQDALDKLAERRPDLATAAQTVARLRPFYDRARERGETRLPFDPMGADDQVRDAIGAIELIGSG